MASLPSRPGESDTTTIWPRRRTWRRSKRGRAWATTVRMVRRPTRAPILRSGEANCSARCAGDSSSSAAQAERSIGSGTEPMTRCRKAGLVNSGSTSASVACGSCANVRKARLR